jgi:ABC-type lipoprotein export system ATPase subunit
MKEFAQNEPTVLLPAHDPEAAKRLAEGLTMYEGRVRDSRELR